MKLSICNLSFVNTFFFKMIFSDAGDIERLEYDFPRSKIADELEFSKKKNIFKQFFLYLKFLCFINEIKFQVVEF